MKRFIILDVSRFLAALVVLNSHFVGILGLPFLENSPNFKLALSFLWNGEAAVSYFFLLSGFVLAIKYLEEDFKLNLIEFYIQRIFRIYPLYIFMLLLSVFVINNATKIGINPDLNKGFMSIPIGIVQFFRECFLIFNTPSISAKLIIPQSWTLSIEFIFSLLIPFMILIVRQSIFWLICASLILLKLFQIDANIILFAMGIILAKMHTNNQIKIKNIYLPLLLLIGIFFFNFNFLFETRNKLTQYAIPFGSLLIFLFFLSKENTKSILQNVFLVKISNSSYSVYIVHMLIIKFFSLMIFHVILTSYPSLNNSTIWLFIYFITLVFVIIFSMLCYHFIEKPFISLGKFVTLWLKKNLTKQYLK